MPECIEREKALKLIESGGTWGWSKNALYDEMKNLPAADVAPVVHGKNLTKCHPVDEFICSHCGAIFRDVALCKVDEDSGDESYYEFEIKFCPRFGMKVDLKEDK